MYPGTERGQEGTEGPRGDRGAKRGQRGGGEGGRARQKICREHVRTGRGGYERAELALGLSHFHGKCVDTLQVLRAQVGFRV